MGFMPNPNLAGLKDKWFHDIFDVGGAAHDPGEVEVLRLLNAMDEQAPRWPIVEMPAGASAAPERRRGQKIHAGRSLLLTEFIQSVILYTDRQCGWARRKGEAL